MKTIQGCHYPHWCYFHISYLQPYPTSSRKSLFTGTLRLGKILRNKLENRETFEYFLQITLSIIQFHCNPIVLGMCWFRHRTV